MAADGAVLGREHSEGPTLLWCSDRGGEWAAVTQEQPHAGFLEKRPDSIPKSAKINQAQRSFLSTVSTDLSGVYLLVKHGRHSHQCQNKSGTLNETPVS